MRYLLLTLYMGCSLFSMQWQACTSSPSCAHEAISQRYTYDTTCTDIAKNSTGPLNLQLEATTASANAIERMLRQQVQNQGLSVEEWLLQWSPTQCDDSSQTSTTPRKATGFVRIVLLPQDESSLQVLLVCSPISTNPPGTLQSSFLFSCRRGQSSAVSCTFQLKPAP